MPPAPDQTTASGPALDRLVRGQPGLLDIVTRDSQGFPLRTGGFEEDFVFELTGNGPSPASTITINDNHDGTYTVEVFIAEDDARIDGLSVQFNTGTGTAHIRGSPYALRVALPGAEAGKGGRTSVNVMLGLAGVGVLLLMAGVCFMARRQASKVPGEQEGLIRSRRPSASFEEAVLHGEELS